MIRQIRITKTITNRSEDSLEKYLYEISKEELISAEEEVNLAQKIRCGDQKAADRLIKANLRFVVSVAKQYQHQGLSLPDLISEGNIGLIKAALKFDETKGFKFISYAVWWIRQSIHYAVSEYARLVRLPVNKLGILNNIYKTCQAFEQENEREPLTEEVADKMKMDANKIRYTIGSSAKEVSYDIPFAGEEEKSLLDVLENTNENAVDHNLMYESLQSEIDNTLQSLSNKERTIIKLFFGIGTESHSIEEISYKLGVTRERARQIKERALKRLKINPKNKYLAYYV